MSPVTGIAEVDAALQRLWPRMSRERWVVLGLCALILAGTAVFVTQVGMRSEDLRLRFTPLLVPALTIPWMLTRLRRRHEAAVLPLLATTAGLTFDKHVGKLRATVPPGLLPKIGIEAAEDRVTGTFGGRKVSATEVKVETGGRNRRALFDGFVVMVPNLVERGRFTLALESETRAAFLSPARQDVEGLRRYDSLTRGDRAFGLWGPNMTDPPVAELRRYLDRLFQIEATLGGGDGIFAAVRTRDATHVAVRHKRDLFRLGGVFATAESIGAQVRTAFEDLRLPLKVAEAIIAAEAELSPSSAAAPASPAA